MPAVRPITMKSATLLLAIALGGLTSPARGEVVATFAPTLGGFLGVVDFGLGGDALHNPANGCIVQFTYTTNGIGQVTCSATIDGTLYWDSPSAGFAELRILFLDSAGHLLIERTLRFSGAGGDPNQLANQLDVHETFLSPQLVTVVLLTGEAIPTAGGRFSFTPQDTRTLNAPLRKRYFISINNDVADFGSTPHVAGTPAGGLVQFDRAGGTMQFTVLGTLFWDALYAGSDRLIVTGNDRNEAALPGGTQVDLAGPGLDLGHPLGAMDAANQRAVNAIGPSPLDGRLWKVRLQVGPTTSLNGAFIANKSVTKRIDFNGSVTGTFTVTPPDVEANVNDPVDYAFTWTVPSPQNWHDLAYLDFRVRDGEQTLIQLRFDEATRTFSVLNEHTGEYSHPAAPGDDRFLETPWAALDLSKTTVVGSGPTGPSVTLNLPLTFKPRSASDRTLAVDVGAGNDEGNGDDFVQAGTLVVGGRSPKAQEIDRMGTEAAPLGLRVHPNPVTGKSMSISYEIPEGGGARVELGIFDLSGRRIRTLVSRTEGPGPHAVSWDLRRDDGKPVSNGAFFYHLDVDHRRTTGKLVVVGR